MPRWVCENAECVGAIGVDNHRDRAAFNMLQSAQDGGELGDVVRCMAEGASDFAHVAVVVEHRGTGGGAGVAVAGAVGEDVNSVWRERW